MPLAPSQTIVLSRDRRNHYLTQVGRRPIRFYVLRELSTGVHKDSQLGPSSTQVVEIISHLAKADRCVEQELFVEGVPERCSPCILSPYVEHMSTSSRTLDLILVLHAEQWL